MRQFDVVVIGGGAAGLSAALAARGRGASVLLVERERLGGECTWTGCVPSKAVIEIAARVWTARAVAGDIEVDFGRLMEGVRRTIEQIAEDESRPTLERYGITVASGHARFVSPTRIDVDGAAVRADHTVIATGTTPRQVELPGLQRSDVLTNETIFDITALPARLAVLGGGSVGLELAQAFNRLGSDVTLLEVGSRVADREEPEASEVIERVLLREGVSVRTAAAAEAGSRSHGEVTLRLTDGTRLVVDAVLDATGRVARTDSLDVDRAGVQLDPAGFVRADTRLRTTASTIYAVGDVTGLLPFTHAGDEMGRIAIANALSRLPRRRWSARAVPWATFTDPEIGRVGMTEAQAFAAYGDAARVVHLPLDVTDRARVAGRTDGFVKLIAGPHPIRRGIGGGELIGATIVSPVAADLVQAPSMAIQTRAITGRLAQTVSAYPSWSIAVRQAAAQFFTRTSHGEARPARAAG